MSVIVRLQNLPWSAVAADIRQFFSGLSIPEGGVNIVGGELGDAFISFSTDEDARLAMQRDGGKVKDSKVKLLLSSRTEMQRETARQQSLQMQYLQMIPCSTFKMQSAQNVQVDQAMQSVSTPQPSAATQPAAATAVPAAAISGYPMQATPTLPNNSSNPGAPNLQPSAMPMQNLQHMYGQMMAVKTEPSSQPSSITPGINPIPGMPGGPHMQFPTMTPYSMATSGTHSALSMSAANSAITSTPSSIPQPALLSSTSSVPFQVRNQPNLQQLQPGQVPTFHTASPQITQTLPYQMSTSQVTQSPVTQALTSQMSHTPGMQTANHLMTQPANFQSPNQQMTMLPNFQPPTHQMPQPGFQPPIMNQPPPFQAGAPRISQPPPYLPSNPHTEANFITKANQSMPFQPTFSPSTHTPAFQMANQQGSPASSFQSPQVAQSQSSQNNPKASLARQPLQQRKTENKVHHDNSDSNKNERSRRSRSGSTGSTGSRSQSRDHRNRDRYPDKDKRRRNSREHRRGRRDQSWSKERRSSRDRKRDDDSRWGRRSDNKRSTDPKQLYRDYENPNSALKPSVVPAGRSKVDANSNSKTSSSTTVSATSTIASTTVSSNLEPSRTTAPETKSDSTDKSENRESDKKSNSLPITSISNNSDKSSQQNDQMNKIESSSPNNKNISSSGFSNFTSNELVSANLSSNSPFISSDYNKTSHDGEESNYTASPLKRKAPNDVYDQDSHFQNNAKHDEGRRRRRGFDAPGGLDDACPNMMNYDKPRNDHQSGFRNERFNRFDLQYNEPDSFNYSQPPRNDWRRNEMSFPNVNCCVLLDNFPIFNGSKDVIDFFHDLSPNMLIKLQRNDEGHLNSALIRFANYNDKQKGLKRNGFRLKKSVVSVTHINDRDFEEADDALFPQKEASKTRLEEKMTFHPQFDLKNFQCLCLEGDQGVDPIFDCKNIYHEHVRVVFNQINPVELFIHYGVYINRGFVRFENFSKANSARNLLVGLVVDFVPIRILPCTDEQFAEFKKIVESEESHEKPTNDKRIRNEGNKRGRMNKPMFPFPAPFDRHDQRKNEDPRMGNRKDPRILNSSRNEIMSEIGDFQNEDANQRTLLPNPPMEPLHSSPKKTVTNSSCIIMQGLPHNVHYQDIVNFFSSINIQPKQIHVMVDSGVPIGDAFCEFNNNKEADMATQRNNCQLGMNFVHVRLVTQEELDSAVGKDSKHDKRPPQPSQLINNPKPNHPSFAPPPPPPPPQMLPPMQMNNMLPALAPPLMDNQMMMGGGGNERMRPGRFGGMEGGSRGPPFGRDSAPPSDNGFRGGMRGGFNMGRGGGPPSMMHRGRGRGGFESGGRGGRGEFESGGRGGRGGFESGGRGGRGGFESGSRGGRGGFESGGRGGRGEFESGGRGGRGGFESGGRGGRGGFESGGRGGRGGFESGDRGGRGEFESGDRGGRGGFESSDRGGQGVFESGGRGGYERDGRGGYERGGRGGYERGGRGGYERVGRGGRGDRSFPPPSMNAAAPSIHDDDMPDPNEDDLLPHSKVESFGMPGCVVAAENIPFRADVNDIIDFLNNFNLVPENVIRRYDDFGQVTGDARISFKTPTDALEAIRQYDQTYMHKRMIRLRLVR